MSKKIDLVDDTNVLLHVESLKKSKAVGWLLNWLLPGLGQYYAHEWVGGTIYLLLLFFAYDDSTMVGLSVHGALFVLGIITGPVAVASYNSQMIKKVMSARDRQKMIAENPDMAEVLNQSKWSMLSSTERVILILCFLFLGLIAFAMIA